ncbi:hypothetical protein U1Q18_039650 [Sarracenia purpurea var. burkii]
MGSQAEKVYVAIGTDPQDGFATLEWALRKWSSPSISIVILQAAFTTSKNYIYTPFGKLPASYASDEQLEFLRKIREGENDQLLSEYKAFCGKVKTEILKIDKSDEHFHKVIVELISSLEITKLVMGLTFLKSSSGKSRGSISGPFYVHRHKPEFCELFIICGGKLVFPRGENKQGIKEKGTFRTWLGKMLPETATDERSLRNSPSSSTINGSSDQWENHEQEIESYFHHLLSANSGEVVEDDALRKSLPDPDSAAENIEALENRIRKAREEIQLKREEAKENVERHARAEWAICICMRRVEELESRVNEEMAASADIMKDLETAKEQVCEVRTEVEDKKSKLRSILELRRELSNKLRLSSLAKSCAEARLENAVAGRAEMVRKIEELRRQRDVLQRRIEFCREKDAIGMAARLSDLGFDYKEFGAEEIRAATDDFSERLRLRSAGDWTNVYRGRINQTIVAIKMYGSVNGLSQEAFESKVKVLSQIRHPHLVEMIGFCSELKCIVLEYMHNGCLRDALFSVPRSSMRRNVGLGWHARVRIAAEVCSGLGFLHSARPRPIAHGNLNPSTILLDRNLVAKIHRFRPGWNHDRGDIRSDMRAFGNLVMQLLTGRNWAGLVEEEIVKGGLHLVEVLDELAGDWPLDLALELGGLARRCLSAQNGQPGPGTELSMATIMREIDKVRKIADDLAAVDERSEAATGAGGGSDIEDSSDVPSVFLCPIFQDVMKNPHLAADGYSYELEAMEEWLRTGNDTSPTTNLKLRHKLLTPNHTLRSLIQDWQNKRAIM